MSGKLLMEPRLLDRGFRLHDSRHSTLVKVDARPFVRLAEPRVTPAGMSVSGRDRQPNFSALTAYSEEVQGPAPQAQDGTR